MSLSSSKSSISAFNILHGNITFLSCWNYRFYKWYWSEFIKYRICTATQPRANLTSIEQQQLMDGISFEIDNVTFSHHTASVNGIQLHYVIGGQGDPVVLLHGWPETWYAWHKVMPALAKNYTVIAPDLRGLGDSSKPLTGYDGKTLAEDIHQLVTQLGFKSIFLVGHDIGSFVVYPYAAEHPTEVRRLVVMDVPPPFRFLPSASW